MGRLSLMSFVMTTSLLGAGCASNSTALPDGGGSREQGDSSAADLASLFKCDSPGQLCNAHDSCAINPICGDDHLCRPSGYQQCDDELECTLDTCAGLGRCDNSPKAGFCVVRNPESGALACFAKGETKPGDPCSICTPDKDPRNWSPRNGGACDDGKACTKNDYCIDGVCQGTDYSSECSDELTCTVDCDGRGGCITPKLAEDACMIDGRCVSKGGRDATGCGYCDPSRSQTSWTPDGLVCLIDGRCLQAGSKHSGGCAECVPTKNARGWTVGENACLIADTCVAADQTDSLGCGRCDPATKKTAWTPISGKCTIEGRCYDKDAPAPERSCAVCDPTVDALSWTVKGKECLIDGRCISADQTDASGCSSCQPDSDKYGWSALSQKCSIEGSCYEDGASDPSGCLVCSYAKSREFWSVKAGVATSSQSFDASAALPEGWSETHSDALVKWQVVSGAEAASGKNALYYGDTAGGNYLGAGGVHQGEASWRQLVLPPSDGGRVVLVFKVFLSIEEREGFDILAAYLSEGDARTLIWDKSKVGAGGYNRWVQQVVDLSAHAGKTVDLSFFFHTIDATNNRARGIYIDDLALVSGC